MTDHTENEASASPDPRRGDSTVTRGSATVPLTGASVPGGEIHVPSIVGNVSIENEIGRGAMGIVFMGWDKVLCRKVAVKFMPGAGQADEDELKRFFAGARAEAAVRHANVVPVQSAGTVEGIPYIVMDYVDGPTLRIITKRNGQLSRNVAIKIMWDIASAMAALHERGVMHRDLKPANVLFDQEAQLMVTDFGLASLCKGSFAESSSGTPAYMAPEVFEGKPSQQSDVYAMGIIMFELLTGFLPFSGDYTLLREQHEHAPLPLGEVTDAIPERVAEIIERATHKTEVFRYKHAGRFLKALKEEVVRDGMLYDGESALKQLVFKAAQKETGPRTSRDDDEPTSGNYFDRITEIAKRKKANRPDRPPDPPEDPDMDD